MKLWRLSWWRTRGLLVLLQAPDLTVRIKPGCSTPMKPHNETKVTWKSYKYKRWGKRDSSVVRNEYCILILQSTSGVPAPTSEGSPPVFQLQGADAMFWPLWAPIHRWHTLTQTYTYIKIKYFKNMQPNTAALQSQHACPSHTHTHIHTCEHT